MSSMSNEDFKESDILTVKQCGERWMEREKKLKEQICVEDNCVVFRVRGEYDIPLSRIDNHTKMVWWVHHLCEKNWITTELICRFIEEVTHALGQKMYNGEG
jgi:hypothetical protein